MDYQSKDELEKYARIYKDALDAYENYDRYTDDYNQLVSDLKNAEQEYFDALTNFANDYAPEDVKTSYLNEQFDTPEVGAWEKYVFEGSPWANEPETDDDNYQDFLKWVDFSPMNHPESWAINDDEAFSKMSDEEFYAPENIKNVHASFGIGPVVGKKGPLQPLSLDEIDAYYKNNPSAKDEAYKWYLEAKQDGWKAQDVNGDGDTDVATADTNGNGEKDTAVVTADSEPEKKEAVKAAKEDLGLDKKDKTSTGKTKGELEKDKDVVSDEKKKDMTCSDATQKNIMAALLDHRF